HSIHLSITLSLPNFYTNHQLPRPCTMSHQTGIDNAIDELDALLEEGYKDSTFIMQLFRDNLTLWTSDVRGSGT
ncbi:14-3-3-domain-containing protein, partial [Gymnopus androsaceus JB14]